MKVERETAGFALPFTAGVLLAVYSGYCIRQSLSPLPAIAFIAAALSLALLMHPARRRYDVHLQWASVGLAALSAGMVCGFTSIHISAASVVSDFGLWAQGWGSRMQEAIDRIPFADSRCNAVAKALVTGERSDIPREIVLAFRESGASHILALSGLHLGIIYAIINRSLSVTGNYRILWIPRSVAIMLMCGFYTIATGAGPSIVRAFLFIVLAEIGRLTHRHRSTGQLLLTALIIQLTISPLSVKSVGFQLSYAAMAGIAFIFPRLKGLWPGSVFDDGIMTRCTRWIWEVCSMSISCQLATGALAWLYFRTLPKHFLLTNLLAIPLTGLIIPAIMITLILNEMGICPVFVLQTAEWMISTLIRVLEIIATM
ncbi:MAG: ComEC/Rec2 family competence protein [Bacteroidales bacterium]|nr:ComEC/Rec2 family competence protein [Bacteroidales bacterium]